MDPLSITASAIAVLSAVTGAGRGLNRIVDLRKAPAEIQALYNEVEALRSLLSVTQNALLDIRDTELYRQLHEPLEVLLRPVEALAIELEQLLEFRLKRQESISPNAAMKVDYVEWLKADKAIARIRQDIRDARGNLEAGLTAANISIR